MKPYYYVFKHDGGHPPTRKHETIEDAIKESQRLAKLHPGQIFEICKVIAITQCTEPNTFWMDGESPELEIEKPSQDREFKVGDLVRIIARHRTLFDEIGTIEMCNKSLFWVNIQGIQHLFGGTEIEHVTP